MKATQETLRFLVEQSELSVDGEWFVLDMRDLLESGKRYLEIHFDDGSEDPNEVRILDRNGD